MEDSLKRCPLCGGDPRFEFWMTTDHCAGGRITCTKCFVEVTRYRQIHFNTETNPGVEFMTLEHGLRDAWNSRVEED